MFKIKVFKHWSCSLVPSYLLVIVSPQPSTPHIVPAGAQFLGSEIGWTASVNIPLWEYTGSASLLQFHLIAHVKSIIF